MLLDGNQLIVSALSRIQTKLGIGGGVPPTRQINTQAPLIGGGDLSADRLLILPQSSAGADGYLSAGDFASFAAKENALTFTPPITRVGNVVSWTGDTDDVPEASNLYFTDARARAAFSATAPVALSAGGVISMAKATAAVDGYLAAADFTTFNAKVSTSRAIATTSPLTGGGDLSADRTFELDFTTAWTWTANGIGATPTDRVILSNTTAAAAGAQQYSPALRFTGQGWKTNATAASQPIDFRMYVQPVQGAANVLGNLLIDFSVNGGAFSNSLTLAAGSTGTLTIVGDLNARSGRTFGQGGALVNNADDFRWSGRARMQSPADGQIVLLNAAASDFTRLQFGATNNTRPALGLSGVNLLVQAADGTDASNLGIGTSAPGTSFANGLYFGTTAGTSPSTSVDLVHLYALDISAGHRSLAIWSEEVVNTATAVASTHRLPITINGTQYALLLTTVLA